MNALISVRSRTEGFIYSLCAVLKGSCVSIATRLESLMWMEMNVLVFFIKFELEELRN